MSTPTTPQNAPLTRKDFQSSIDPRWCPGCGCYAVYKTVTDVFPTMGIPKENFAVISGIGCSSRFPYYTSCYGFHGIHGRAPTLAIGLKLARPELSVWVITGDGDSLSIGGNHFIHLMRRNPDIKVILFNNQIYGLTKGQASPTTQMGTKTKTTPGGAIDNPMRPLSMAIAAGATYVARAHDTDPELLKEVIVGAANHKGIAFVEVMMNCVIFNDGAIEPVTGKSTRAETTVRLRAGEPLVFGANKDKAIRIGVHNQPEVVSVADAGTTILKHNPTQPDSAHAYMLSQLSAPMAFGIFRQISLPTYETKYVTNPEFDIDKILKSGNSWVTDEEGKIKPLDSSSK